MENPIKHGMIWGVPLPIFGNTQVQKRLVRSWLWSWPLSTIGCRLPERTSRFLNPSFCCRRFIHTKDYFGPPGASDRRGCVFFCSGPMTWICWNCWWWCFLTDDFCHGLNHHFWNQPPTNLAEYVWNFFPSIFFGESKWRKQIFLQIHVVRSHVETNIIDLFPTQSYVLEGNSWPILQLKVFGMSSHMLYFTIKDLCLSQKSP